MPNKSVDIWQNWSHFELISIIGLKMPYDRSILIYHYLLIALPIIRINFYILKPIPIFVVYYNELT